MSFPLRQKKPAHKSRPLYRKKLLRRGCHYRPLDDGDMKWLWGAYLDDSLTSIAVPDLDETTFPDAMRNLFTLYYERQGQAFLLEGHFIQYGGNAPVGLMLVDESQGAFWPHTVWFDWATPRNKIETSVKFFQDLNHEGNVMFVATRQEIPFYSHLARYGLVNRRGTLKKYFGANDGILYQGVRQGIK